MRTLADTLCSSHTLTPYGVCSHQSWKVLNGSKAIATIFGTTAFRLIFKKAPEAKQLFNAEKLERMGREQYIEYDGFIMTMDAVGYSHRATPFVSRRRIPGKVLGVNLPPSG